MVYPLKKVMGKLRELAKAEEWYSIDLIALPYVAETYKAQSVEPYMLRFFRSRNRNVRALGCCLAIRTDINPLPEQKRMLIKRYLQDELFFDEQPARAMAAVALFVHGPCHGDDIEEIKNAIC